MKRHPQLQDLSRDHHHALVLARQSRIAAKGSDDEVHARLVAAREKLERELAPHFAVEERLLLPALDDAGLGELAARTRTDHARLRELLRDDAPDERARLREFGELLRDHVRFEESELFPAAEATLDDATLTAVADASAALESAERRRACDAR
ncbi:MAG: hemerythrin domain-containing protein [Deltaproteobacteria bacterium]|nr:hemerythrin domain-containing protein [Deltaproteobacteria bacterium]